MRPKSRNDFAIAIICALPFEADAVESLFDETYDRLGKYYSKQQGDANSYVNGRIGKHNVVLCYMPGIGKGSAGSVASGILVSYRGIELALVVGICGGAPSPSSDQQIFLGDVIISDSVIEYDFGRQYPGGFQRKTGVKDTLGRPGREIRTLLNGLSAHISRSEFQNQTQQYLHALQQQGTRWHHPQISDVLFKTSYLHKHHGQAYSTSCCCMESDLPNNICKDALEKNCDDLGCDKNQVIRCQKVSKAAKVSIHIGTVASADTVMKSGQHRDEIIRRERVIGFEMEGAGVWDNLPCLIIKGVCDYADSHKSKSWQAYAAATGASAAKAFLEYWKPANQEIIRVPMRIQSKIQISKSVFFGREMELNQLQKLFDPTIPTRQTAVIWGLSGYGKTQLALEYITTRRARYESILWIDSSSRAMIEQSFEDICSQLPPSTRDERSAVDRLLGWLEQGTHGSWIMVLDGVESFDNDDGIDDLDIRTFFPSCNHGHILLVTTSPDLHLRLGFPDIPVQNVDDQTGAKILMRCAGGKISDSSAQTTAMAISRKLGGMPLAIQQAGCFLSYGIISMSDYNRRFQIRYLDKTLKTPLRKYVGSYEKGRTIWTTFDILYSALVQRSLDSMRLLTLAAFLGRGRIPFNTISGKDIDYGDSSEPFRAFTQSEPKGFVPELLHWLIELRSDIDRVALAIREVEASGFIWFHRSAGNTVIESFAIHDLARSFIQSKVSQQGALDVLATSFLISGLQLYDGCNMPTEALLRKHMGRLVGVLDLFLTSIPDHMLEPPDGQYFRLCAVVAPVYARMCRFQGRLDAAAGLWKIALQYRLSPDVSQMKHDVNREDYMEAADVDARLGNYKDAIDKYSTILTWSENDPSQVDELAIQAAGCLRQVRERYEQHKQYLEQVVTSYSAPKAVPQNVSHDLEIDEHEWELKERYQEAANLFGSADPETLWHAEVLSSYYRRRDQRWKEAEELEMHVMEIRKQMLGPEHPHTLTSMHNLASTYRGQRRWKEAEELEAAIEGYTILVSAVAFSPDGKLVASGSSDKTVKLWDPATGTLQQTLKGHSNWVRAVAFSPDGKLVASGSSDKTVKLWDPATSTLQQTLKGHSSSVSAVAFSPNSKLVASGSIDKTIKLWDLTTSTLQQTLEGHSNWVWAVAFSPDGKLVASGSSDKTVKLWDPATGTLKRTLEGHSDWVRAVAFSPDGKLVASGSSDKTVKLWDPAIGTLQQTLEGHSSWVNTVVFSSNGKLVASGSNDRTVKLWDLATSTLQQTLKGHSNWVWAVAFSSDSKLVASGSSDTTVKLWDLATVTLQQTLKSYSNCVGSTRSRDT